ncbi:MAG: ATP-binding protein [Bacilli bacterium]|nr:ATP-binding protein [Bacilli bacterium]
MNNLIDESKYYKRKIDNDLEKWALNTAEKTIALIKGVRRVGKTHSLMFLGQKHFKQYKVIQVNDLTQKEVKFLMDKTDRVKNFYEFLLSKFNIDRSVVNRNFLVIFDEIQEHSELKELISFLNRELECRFACTGSALWIYDTNGTKATGNYELFSIYPFSFVQFLDIVGEDLDLIKKEKTIFESEKDKTANQELLKLFRTYVAIGGMPQVIKCYLEHKNDDDLFYKLNCRKKTSIVSTYEQDLNRYQTKLDLDLFSEYKNIIRNIGLVKDINNLKNIYEKLEAMNVIVLCKNLNDINKKLSSSVDEYLVKPFLLDTGILFYYLCENDNENLIISAYKDFIDGIDRDNNGYLYENYVASTLIQKGIPPFFKAFQAKDDNNETKNYELDFVFGNVEGPVAIEAKSGTCKKHKSLEVGLKKFQKLKQSYLLCDAYKFDKGRIQRGTHYIPFYALDFLIG